MAARRIGPCGQSTCTTVVGTTDGGATWNSLGTIDSPLTMGEDKAGLAEVRFADDLHGWAFGPALWATKDGGVTWTKRTAPGGRVVLALDVVCVERAGIPDGSFDAVITSGIVDAPDDLVIRLRITPSDGVGIHRDGAVRFVDCSGIGDLVDVLVGSSLTTIQAAGDVDRNVLRSRR